MVWWILNTKGELTSSGAHAPRFIFWNRISGLTPASSEPRTLLPIQYRHFGVVDRLFAMPFGIVTHSLSIDEALQWESGSASHEPKGSTLRMSYKKESISRTRCFPGHGSPMHSDACAAIHYMRCCDLNWNSSLLANHEKAKRTEEEEPTIKRRKRSDPLDLAYLTKGFHDVNPSRLPYKSTFNVLVVYRSSGDLFLLIFWNFNL
jgi:hypothetical protein